MSQNRAAAKPQPVLEIDLRQVYGGWSAYPLNDAAKALAAIAGTTTLTTRAINIAKDKLGYKVVTRNAALSAVAARLES